MQQVKVSLPEDLLERLTAEAARNQESLSLVIRRRIRLSFGTSGDFPPVTREARDAA